MDDDTEPLDDNADTEPSMDRIIYAYTRTDAIDDGVLIDVSDTGREAGFTWPVAITAAVYDKYVRVPHGLADQHLRGRLWDVLWMARMAIKRAPAGGRELLYELRVANDERGPLPVTLKLVSGPGDNAEPVITIMMPDED